MPKEPHELAPSVTHEVPKRHIKHRVQFFQRPTLRLGQEQQNEYKAGDVPAGVPPEGTGGGHGGLKAGPGHREEEVEEPGGGGGEGHAEGPDVQRVGLGGVGEGDGALAGGVDHAEEVEAHDDHCDAGGAHGEPEAEAGPEEEDGHELGVLALCSLQGFSVGGSWTYREGRQEKVPPTEAINGPERRQGEEEVDDAEAERGAQRGHFAKVGGEEDLGRVICDNLYKVSIPQVLRVLLFALTLIPDQC